MGKRVSGNTFRSVRAVILLSAALGLAACEGERAQQPPVASQQPAPQSFSKEAAEQLSRDFWLAGEAQLIEAQGAVEALNRALIKLLDQPSEDHLEGAKLAWLDAHRQFAAALPYIRLGFAPAAVRDQGRQLLLAVDSWPTQPGYLDTVPGYSDSGIVNDTAIELTLANLRKQHRLTAHEEASTGFHALEVMLWGPTSERSAEQFVAVTEGEKPEALASNRRRELTSLIGRALAEDVDALAKRWPLPANDLSQHFLALSPAARLQQIRAAHTQVVDEELLRRLPESSESDVESTRAADSKQALLTTLRTLEANWLPAEGDGMAKLLLTRPQATALENTFAALEDLLLKMEDPIELAELGQLAQARQLLEELAGLMSGTTQVQTAEEDMTPVSLPLSE